VSAAAAPALATLFALLGAAPAPAAPVAATPPAEPLAVRVRLDRKDVRLGEPFELTIEVRHATAERYALPAALPIEPFRLLGAGCPRREEGAEAVTTCALRLALYDLGAHDLPELVLRAETPGGGRELRVPGPGVTGIGILDPAAPAASLALKDLAPPAPLHVPNWPLAAGLLAAALSAAAGGWGWRAWCRRSRRVEEPPPLPPHERFSRQLDALEEARLASQGRAREHFLRLSGHVREYLGAVTGQSALDLTSAELLARLAFQPDPRLELRALRAFLESADLVKFARAPATAAEADDALRFARTLLDRTRPRPPAPPGPEGR
jgi:hypothetical protein